MTPPFARHVRESENSICPCEFMPFRLAPPSRCSLVILMSGTFACSGGDLLLPEPPGQETVALTKYDGDGQRGMVGEQLPGPLVVRVLTAVRESPASGRKVAFVLSSAGGQVSPDTAITNGEGLAIAHLLLGTAPGPYVIEARLVAESGEPQIQEFTASAIPAAPDTLSALSRQSQAGRRNQEVVTQPVVRVVDRFGNPVPDVPVSWQVTAGEGQTSSISRTDAEGSATAQWTLGNQIGIQKLVASVEQAGVPSTTFTATVFF